MPRQERKDPNFRHFAATLAGILSLSVSAQLVNGQSPKPGTQTSPDISRMERLEKVVETVLEENRNLAEESRTLKEEIKSLHTQTQLSKILSGTSTELAPARGDLLSSPNFEPPVVPPDLYPASPDDQESNSPKFRFEYDNGFAILPEDPDQTPFSLRIRNQNMFRYDGFDPSKNYWTDSAGDVLPISSSSNFQIPRGRLIFSGSALMPGLSYLLNIDYNSVTSNPIGFRAYGLGYRFNRALELSVGQNKVPGTREWLESAFAPLQSPDRSMATTFFRPSLSQGIWITGEPVDGWNYHAMMSNGFNTLNLVPNQLNNRFCWSGSTWWEPLGDFGRGYSDVQDHEEGAVRIGSSYTFALGKGNQADSDAVENSPVRLSDGTLITKLGALAPGATLQTYDISLAACDLAYKSRGFGISTELYFQNLLNLKANGPIPIGSTGAVGGFVQGGYFVLPQSTELYARTSWVTGKFGSGSELGAGLNWFILKGNENLRFTFDAAWLDSSPAGQNRTGFVAGQTGLLVRTQITVVY